MSRAPWLGRPAGKHAAGGRGRARHDSGQPAAPPRGTEAGRPAPVPAPAAQTPPAQTVPPPAAAAPLATLAGSGGLLGAPVLADDVPALSSPVTDAARAAVAASSAALPARIPAGAAPALTIDALGRKCPIPIIMLAEQIRDVPVGAVIALLADDPAAYSDIPAWCGLKSHDCVFRAEYATGWSFGIRRRY
jgi:tRNA 2-thiouridine synthesizing protein A